MCPVAWCDSPPTVQLWPLFVVLLAPELGISFLVRAHQYHQKTACIVTGIMHLGYLPIQMEKTHQGANYV